MPNTRRFVRGFFAFIGGAALLGAPQVASANGRLPGSNQLLLGQPNGDGAIVIRASFGLAVRKVSGGPFHWVCEQALGYEGELDPGVQLIDGAIVVAGPAALMRSSSEGCNFTQLLPGNFTDVSSDRPPVASPDAGDGGDAGDEGAPSTSAIAVREDRSPEGCVAHLFASEQGTSWTPLGTPIPTLCPFTLDRAPSRHERIYVSGHRTEAGGRLHGYIAASDDSGQTWTMHRIPDEPFPFIAAVDPADPDLVYVRTNDAELTSGKGRLLVSRNGGASFSQIAELSGLPLQHFGITGFALSPDGSKVAFGSVNEGLFVMNRDGGGQPESRAQLPVMCLTWTSSALFACGLTTYGTKFGAAPFVIGKSSDEGRTFTPVLQSLTEIEGPEQCGASSSVNETCASLWPAMYARFGDAGVSADAGLGGGDAGPGPVEQPKLSCDCSSVALGGDGAAYGGALAFLASASAGALAVVRRRSRRR